WAIRLSAFALGLWVSSKPTRIELDISSACYGAVSVSETPLAGRENHRKPFGRGCFRCPFSEHLDPHLPSSGAFPLCRALCRDVARLGGRTVGTGEWRGDLAGGGYCRARGLPFSRLRVRRLARHGLYHCGALDGDHRAPDLFDCLRRFSIRWVVGLPQ